MWLKEEFIVEVGSAIHSVSQPENRLPRHLPQLPSPHRRLRRVPSLPVLSAIPGPQSVGPMKCIEHSTASQFLVNNY
jgi:hypothetical protein